MWDNGGADSGVMLARYCRVPDSFLDLDMAGLNRAELVVYLYICRRTVGFNKRFEAISLQQFMTGIVTREGRRLDFGTGLCRKTVLSALHTLENLRLIFRHTRHRENGAQITSVFELNLDGVSTYRFEKNPGKENKGEGSIKDSSEGSTGNFGEANNESYGESYGEGSSESFGEGGSEGFGEEFLPFGYLDDQAEERSVAGETRWVFPAPDEGRAVNAPGPGPKITPEVVVEITPGPGEKMLPTINRGYKNKDYKKTLLHRDGLKATGPFGQECDEVERILLENGVWSGLAVQIARQATINRRGKVYLEGWLKWLAGQPNIANRGGYLVKVIQANSDPPDPSFGKSLPGFNDPATYRDKHRQRTQQLADSLRRMGIKVP